MNSVPIYIEDHTKLTDVFGYWPRFHDSPVFTLTATDSQINLILQVWEMTSEIDDRGYFILKNHHLVHFRFDAPSEIALKDSESGNILFELAFSTLEEFQEKGSFQVRLDSVMDLDSSFRAKQGTILDVLPCDSKGIQTEQDAAANP